MSRWFASALLAGLLVAVVVSSTARAANNELRVTEARGSAFPGRAYVLTLPRGMRLSSGTVQVLENGQPVDGVVVTPVSEAKPKQFGVVLVIDASMSMQGKPEKAALDAAGVFAAHRQPEEQLALVTYNSVPTVGLTFTSKPDQIAAALAQAPKILYGTHIYDAVAQGIQLLKAAHISAGSVVLLSDGQEARAHGDKGPHQTEPSVAGVARVAHVRVFTVGLHSHRARLGVLRRLADDTGGSYVEAKSIDDLATIYNQLGTQLANDYLLHYRSLAGPGRRIHVVIQVQGLSDVAKTAYETPKLAILKPLPRAPYRVPVSRRIWTSTLTMAVVGLLVAVLIGLGAALVLSTAPHGTVRQRLAEFVSVPALVRDSNKRPTAQLTEKMLEGTQTLLRDATWWQKFRWELEIASISMPAEQIVVLSLLGSIVTLAVFELAGHLLIGLLLALGFPFGVRAYLRRQLNRRRAQFAEQLPDNLQVLSSALRAGHSFVGALSVVVNDAPEPARSEFQRVIADEQLGVPVDQALHTVVERMENRDLEQVALVAALQHETGGNTAEVLDRVTDTIRERFELRRTVRTLTAQGRLSRWILTALPIVLFLLVNLINPGYMKILYTSTAGKVFIGFAVVSLSAGSFVIRRIVNIRV
jgi:tight adherence protein B